jgi:hypothetical protein
MIATLIFFYPASVSKSLLIVLGTLPPRPAKALWRLSVVMVLTIAKTTGFYACSLVALVSRLINTDRQIYPRPLVFPDNSSRPLIVMGTVGVIWLSDDYVMQ